MGDSNNDVIADVDLANLDLMLVLIQRVNLIH